MRIRISRKSLLTHSPQIITGLWMIGILFVWYWQLLGIGKWEFATYNMRFHWRGPIPPDPRVVLLALDEQSVFGDSLDEEEIRENPGYELLKDFPYPRKAWAIAVEKLAKAGARAVVLDLVLSKSSPFGDEKMRREDNAAFTRMLIKHRDKVVVGADIAEGERGASQLTGASLAVARPDPELMPSEIVPDDELVGFVNYKLDSDGFTRRMNPVRWPVQFEDFKNVPPHYSIDALAVKKAFPSVRLPDPYETRFIQFAGPNGGLGQDIDAYRPYPFYLIFRKKAWDPERPPFYGGTFFKDKIVVIGPYSTMGHDDHLAPFGEGNPGKMYGVAIHANAIATLLSNRTLREIGHVHMLWPLGIIGTVGLILSFLLHIAKAPFAKFIPAFALGFVYLYISQFLFEGFDLFIPLVPVLALISGSTVSVVTLQAIMERIEKQRARGFLTRYVSRNVAEELLQRGEDVDAMLKPQKRFVTVLMSDVRDFTTMTESSEPGPFVHQLNEYLTAMVECVFKHNGTLDKFVGDAVMAVFGNPPQQSREEDALCAVKTALEMRKRLAELNVGWEKEGRTPFRFGIGINAGEVMAGDIGSSQKAEFGVIGDTVNVSARVEGLTKLQKADILITDAVYDLVKDRVEVEPRGEMQVKGRAKAVQIYALKALKV